MSMPRELEAAIANHRRGDTAAAVKGYQRYLKKDPRHAGVWHLLASASFASGDTGKARDAAGKSVRIDPQPLGHRLLYADILLAGGEYDEALEQCRKLLKDAPDEAGALQRHARAQRLAGDPAGALETLERCKSDTAAVLYEKGLALTESGRHEEARRALTTSVELHPDNAGTFNALAVVLLRLGLTAEAIAPLNKARDLDASNPEIRINLITACKLAGRLTLALEEAENLEQEHPGLVDAVTLRASTQQALGHYLEARAGFEQALRMDRDNVAGLAGLAELDEWQGDFENGLKRVTDVTADSAPDLVIARARLLRQTGKPKQAIQLLRGPRDESVWLPWNRVQADFALAAMLDQSGDHDDAFTSAVAANRSRNRSFDRDAHSALVDRVIAAPLHLAAEKKVIPQPVLIVGMPRSGTSLLEQVLAGHDQVFAAGELPLLGQLALDGGQWPVVGNDPVILAELGRQYLDGLPGDDRQRPYLTDKMPVNFLYLGLAAAIIPGLRVIHCLRDPRDIALSCFFQDFTDPALSFSFDLDNIAAYYLDYWRLMAHWRRQRGIQMHEVYYEDLVGDLEVQTRRILAYLDLDWQPACLEFHTQRRQIHTASYDQVRKPLYRSSIARHRHYQPALADFSERIGAEVLRHFDPGRRQDSRLPGARH